METNETQEMLTQSHMIEGTYGDKEIKINTFPVRGNKNVLINIHGTFGSLKGGNNKYLNFASKLQESNSSNVVLYESSRQDLPNDDTITDRYKQKQAKFIGKTFLDELEDAKRVVLDSIQKSQELYGVKSEDLEITLNGNSLGGILAFYIASDIPQIKNISTVGTGLRLEIKDVPILDTFPERSELEEKLEGFKGNLLMHYGSEDDVFTPEAFSDFYQKAGTSEKSFIQLIGVDHTFGKVGGEFSQKPYNEVFSSTETLLKEGKLVSGVDNLLNDTQTKVMEVKHSVSQALIDKYMVPDDEDIDFVG